MLERSIVLETSNAMERSNELERSNVMERSIVLETSNELAQVNTIIIAMTKRAFATMLNSKKSMIDGNQQRDQFAAFFQLSICCLKSSH